MGISGNEITKIIIKNIVFQQNPEQRELFLNMITSIHEQ